MKQCIDCRYASPTTGHFMYYINVSPSLKIPPLTEIRELVHSSQEVERSEENEIGRAHV